MQQFFIKTHAQKKESSLWLRVPEEYFTKVLQDVGFSPSYNKAGTMITAGFQSGSFQGRVVSGSPEEIESAWAKSDPDFVLAFKTIS